MDQRMHHDADGRRLSSHSSYAEALAALDGLVRRGVPRDQLCICAVDLRPVRPDRSGPTDDAAAMASLGGVTGGLLGGAFALYNEVNPIVLAGPGMMLALVGVAVALGVIVGLATGLLTARPGRTDPRSAELSFRPARYDVFADASIAVVRGGAGTELPDAPATIDVRDGRAGAPRRLSGPVSVRRESP